MPAEHFKKHRLVDRVDSSAGSSIRLRRDRIEYTDQLGTFSIDAERAPGSGTRIMAFSSSFPEEAQWGRDVVFSNLERAFEAARWHLKTLE
jgi:hypothetical protein